MAKRLILVVVSIVGLAACGGRSDDPSVARWDGGALGQTELDHFIMTLPESDRRVDAKDPVSWWKDQAQEAILRELLLQKAGPEAAEGLDAALRNDRRSLVAEAEILRRYGSVVKPTEADLELAWTELEDSLNTGEQRELFNIFRRAANSENQQAAAEELESLRDEILAGRSFEDAALELSDSESRYRRGLIGIVRKGDLDPRLEDIVFSLRPAVPSEPLTTNEGVHIFLVRAVIPGRSATFQESRSDLTSYLQRKRRWQQLEETARELWAPLESDVILEAAVLREALQAGTDGPFLRVGNFEMTFDEWRLWAQANLENPRNETGLVAAYLSLARQEMILQGVEATTGIGAEIQAAIDAAERRQLIERQFEIELRLVVTPAEISSYFASNSRRFATPQRFVFRRLEVPIGENPVAVMDRLRNARVAMDRGNLSFDELAREVDGMVDDLGWITISELVAMLPAAKPFVSGLLVGEHSHPFTTERSLVMIEVVATEQPRTPSLENVRPQVTARYINEERTRLQKRVKESLFAQAGVTFDRSWLERTGEKGDLSSASRSSDSPVGP